MKFEKAIESGIERKILAFTVALFFVFAGCSSRKKIIIPKQTKVLKQTHLAKDQVIVRSFSSTLQGSAKKAEAPFTERKISLKEKIRCIEARLGDLPLPLLVKPVSVSEDPQGGYMIVYTTSLSLDTLKKFYKEEMKQTGWKRVVSFEGDEVLFDFRKQSQSCIVSIRPIERRWWQRAQSTALHLYVKL